MELDETNSKIHEIYERYTNSWEFNDALMYNEFDIDWLERELDIENYRKLETLFFKDREWQTEGQ